MKSQPSIARNIPDEVAWKSLKNLIQRFGFSEEEGRVLMGEMARSSYYRGLGHFKGSLNRDQKERISLLLGIYKSLRILFVDSHQAMTWIDRENNLPPFGGKTPRQHLMEGSILRLAEIRRFLDFWRGH